MRNVRDIVRGFVQDTTVKPKREWTLEEQKQFAQQELEAKKLQQTSKPAAPKPVIQLQRPAEAQHTPSTAEIDTQDRLDPTCEHQWSWKGGVKTCWLCGGPAPQDKRDSSTRWRG